MSTPTMEGVAERPRRSRLFGLWIWDLVVCLSATLPLAIPFFAIVGTRAGTQRDTQREDRWRFDAMPESDGGLMAWAVSQGDLKDLRAERPPGSRQLMLRYERQESKGPAQPDWESLGYKRAYLVSATHPPSVGMESVPVGIWWGCLLAAAVVVGVVAAYRLRRACRLGEPLIWLADRPRPGWWKWLLAGVAGVVLIQLIQIAVLRPFGIDPMAPDETTRMLWRTSGLASATAFLAIVLAIPFAEEVLFRALLLGRFGAHGYWRAGIFVSALVFMLVHLDEVHSIDLFAGGLVLAWLYQRTGSLWPPIALHALNNAFSYALAVLGKHP